MFTLTPSLFCSLSVSLHPVSAASCASYNFSFLSPQGLNFSSQSSAPFWSVFTPRVVSTAVARYNFAARDMRELSLREGDIVKIYSKIGGDQGWWKGEANGRIGWFPSTYVDEEGVQWSSGVRDHPIRLRSDPHPSGRTLWFPLKHLVEDFLLETNFTTSICTSVPIVVYKYAFFLS